MESKGFTLIETVISLVFLSIVCLSILSLVTSISTIQSRDSRKAEMLNIGEITIENLKSFDYEKQNNIYIFGTNIKDIRSSLEECPDESFNFSSGIEYKHKYNIKITKEDKSKDLWKIYVIVSYDEGEKYEEITYNTIISK